MVTLDDFESDGRLGNMDVKPESSSRVLDEVEGGPRLPRTVGDYASPSALNGIQP